MKYTTIFVLLLLAGCQTIGPDQLAIMEENEALTLKYVDMMENGEYSVTYKESFGMNNMTNTRSMHMTKERQATQNVLTDTPSIEEIRSITLPETIVTCTKQDGIWTCLETEFSRAEAEALGEEIANAITQGFENSSLTENLTRTLSRLPQREIAGVTATCYGVVMKENNVEFWTQEQCWSKEGIPLYTEVYSGKGLFMKQEAIAYSLSVDESVFEPPVEPVDSKQYMKEQIAKYGLTDQS